MQASISISPTSPSSTVITRFDRGAEFLSINASKHRNLRFCGLRREALGFTALKRWDSSRAVVSSQRQSKKLFASLSDNGSPSKGFDYDLVIIGAGVGGHGAALHAVEKKLDVDKFRLRRAPIVVGVKHHRVIVTVDLQWPVNAIYHT
ncbi:hypothetical protein HHK36_012282 [Tetracentron sinense]|uniref:Uncharacterized protein n=1 Tax=Tetracentron sinense TaxID=13715 RepID=A0A834ZA28_TETSI|nr:hypothetical protein HHK36_012282 [Tetracentron sinense]